MTDIVVTSIIIYFCIGFGNFASHMLSCHNCQRHLSSIVVFILHAITQFFAWPFDLIGILRGPQEPEWLKKMTKPEMLSFNGYTPDELSEIIQQYQQNGGKPPREFTQE